jgi:hypothetical protein
MSTMSRNHSRADRLREYAAAVELAHLPVAAMGVLVREREARAWTAEQPPEVVFAGTDVDGRALPAAVWVALRREDVDGAVEAMTAASQTQFLVEAREEMGEGYRLHTVEETRPLPEVDLLLAQLSQMLSIPPDVLAILAEWGADDPRTASEIDELLERRCGPVSRRSAPVVPLPAPETAAAPVPVEAPSGRLTMTVAEAASVLRLDDDQARALATLVRCATVTLTA